MPRKQPWEQSKVGNISHCPAMKDTHCKTLFVSVGIQRRAARFASPPRWHTHGNSCGTWIYVMLTALKVRKEVNLIVQTGKTDSLQVFSSPAVKVLSSNRRKTSFTHCSYPAPSKKRTYALSVWLKWHSKSVLRRPPQCHLCYIHAPMAVFQRRSVQMSQVSRASRGTNRRKPTTIKAAAVLFYLMLDKK